MWFDLKGDARHGRCASEGCGGQPTWRLEAGGVGSNYCSGCKDRMEKPIQSPEERREIASRNLAKYFCVIAGIEAVDSLDGSSNWWMFLREAEGIYDGLVKRFPPVRT